MSADRGRLTFTPARRYREVVHQQGRVLLDADWNESQRLQTEDARETALDVVGATGTPDDGYRVAPQVAGFTVGPGTMYVGGLRLTLDAPVSYDSQMDWRDIAGAPPWADGLWREPAALLAGTSAVVLLAREQEITAVEDPALRDVALGGPDTAARTRLLQRMVAIPGKGATCEVSAPVVEAFWSSRGLIADAATARLTSRARLQVTPETTGTPVSACDPPAASGYLGADNQLIRVQIAAVDGSGGGTLLWGYHNASILHRGTVETRTVVRLAARPVAAEFEPRRDQVVQVLSRAADLGEGAFAAALTGHFARLTTAYAADTQTVTLPGALPVAPYPDNSPVFVRLWQDRIDFIPDKPVSLAGTGLQVTITTASKGPLHVGDYWSIAVRPLTPNQVYPERLLTAPQPPDGPRLWACPLAMLTGVGKTVVVADDCRQPFDNLVELTARRGDCACTVCVTPADHQSGRLTLQAAVDAVIKQGGGTVCLEVGTYTLDKALVVAGARSLRLAGKGPASLVRAKREAIVVQKGQGVELTDFGVLCDGSSAREESAIVLQDLNGGRLERLTIACSANAAAVGVRGALSDVAIDDNRINSPVGITDVPDEKTGATGLLDVRIERNQFTCSAIAVRFVNVTVHQHVSRIAANRVSGCQDAGIRLLGASVPGFGVEVVGNELEVIGDGIEAGVDGLRIVDNDLKAFDPKNEKVTAKRAIVLRQGGAVKVLDNVQVAGNRISAFEDGVTAEAALGAVTIVGNQIAGVSRGVTALPTAEAITVAENRMTAVGSIAVLINSSAGRMAVTGNQLDSGVQIVSEGGDCVFSHNHCTLVKAANAPSVALNARTLIVASNRVAGTGIVTLVAQAPLKETLCTVVGNITASRITLNGAPLGAPWAALNLIG